MRVASAGLTLVGPAAPGYSVPIRTLNGELVLIVPYGA